MKKISLINWFHMSEKDVLDRFASLPNAKRVGSNDSQFVYIPGNRDDKVLLVAHADTVWSDAKLSIGFKDQTYFSKEKSVGIGADDRAGCAILWKLRRLGHSLLIPNGEESGCVGSRFLIGQEDWKKMIGEHKFAIEFDRRGNSDLVTYNVGSKDFESWCEANFNGFTKAHGSYTDICVLCKDICGVNISVGYYNQHSGSEILKQNEWNRTLDIARNVLSKNNIPGFKPDPIVTYRSSYNDDFMDSEYGNNNFYKPYNGRYKYTDSYFKEDTRYKEKTGVQKIADNDILDKIVKDLYMCQNCKYIMDVMEYYELNGCPACNCS